MRENIFLGDGLFGSRKVVALGQYSYPVSYPWQGPSTPFMRPPSMQPQPIFQRPAQPGPMTFTRPTSQPIAAGGSALHCYYCEGLSGFPTYWLSEAQADQWNRDRDARCSQVADGNCQQKYNEPQTQQVDFRSFNALNFPSATTYAPMMSGRIKVQNPELIG